TVVTGVAVLAEAPHAGATAGELRLDLGRRPTPGELLRGAEREVAAGQLLLVGLLREVLEVHHQVVRRAPVAGPREARSALGDSGDLLAAQPVNGRGRTAARDEHPVERLEQADVGGARGPHR